MLVAGAELPPRDQLPESLRALTDFNAAQLRHDPDFNVDIGRLTNYLETEAKLKEIKKNIETVTPHLNVATYFVDGRLAEFTPENDAQ